MFAALLDRRAIDIAGRGCLTYYVLPIPMRRRWKILIGVTVLLAGTAIYCREPLTDTYYQVTERERSWLKGSSPLRKPLEKVWHQWKDGDLSHTEAVKLIERTLVLSIAAISIYAYYRSLLIPLLPTCIQNALL